MAARQSVGARWVGLTDMDIARYLESDEGDAWAAEVGWQPNQLACDRFSARASAGLQTIPNMMQSL